MFRGSTLFDSVTATCGRSVILETVHLISVLFLLFYPGKEMIADSFSKKVNKFCYGLLTDCFYPVQIKC